MPEERKHSKMHYPEFLEFRSSGLIRPACAAAIALAKVYSTGTSVAESHYPTLGLAFAPRPTPLPGGSKAPLCQLLEEIRHQAVHNHDAKDHRGLKDVNDIHRDFSSGRDLSIIEDSEKKRREEHPDW